MDINYCRHKICASKIYWSMTENIKKKSNKMFLLMFSKQFSIEDKFKFLDQIYMPRQCGYHYWFANRAKAKPNLKNTLIKIYNWTFESCLANFSPWPSHLHLYGDRNVTISWGWGDLTPHWLILIPAVEVKNVSFNIFNPNRSYI